MAVLILIFLAFIGVGLPDSLLGSAWPFISTEMAMVKEGASYLSIAISLGVISASILNDKIAKKLGNGFTTAFAALLMALSLTGFAFCHHLYTMALCCFPLGFGSGTLQTLFDDYMAVHYPAKYMSWLHGTWGIGAVAGPLILSAFSDSFYGWRAGYIAVAVLEMMIFLVLMIRKNEWDKQEKVFVDSDGTAGNIQEESPKGRRALTPSLMILMGLQFVLYCSMENSLMLWGASYLNSTKALPEARAATLISVFFIGITVGRILGGSIISKLGNVKTVMIACITAAVLDILLFFVSGSAAIAGIILLLGLFMSLIYPALLHQTPTLVSAENSRLVMGLQVSSAYLGILIIPPALGFVFSNVSFSILPVVEAVCILLLMILVLLLNRKGREKAHES